MVTEVIKIEVVDGDVTQATQNINKLDKSIEKVDKTSKKAGDSVSSSLDGASDAASNLSGGVEGAVQQVRVLGKASKKSGAAMKSALISTGIGAFVVLLGIVVDNWEAIGETLGFINKDLERQIKLQRDLIDVSEHDLSILEIKQKQLEASGESTEDIVELRKEETKQLLAQNEALLEKLKLQLQSEQSAAIELSTYQKLVSLVSGQKLIGEVTEEEQENLRKTREQIQSTEKAVEKLKLSLIELNNPKSSSTSNTGGGEEPQQRENQTAISTDFEVEKVKEIALQKADIEAQVTANLDAEAEKRKRIADTELQYQVKQNNVRLAAANNLSSALFQLGEESKEAAVAAIIVDQIAGAAQAIQANTVANAKAVAAFPLTLGQPWVTINTVSTALGIAAGALAAKKAISQIGGGGSVGNVGSPSGGASGGAQAPSFNVVGTSGVNQLAQTLNQEQQPIQAFVVGSDVTSQQEFERNLVDTSSIG